MSSALNHLQPAPDVTLRRMAASLRVKVAVMDPAPPTCPQREARGQVWEEQAPATPARWWAAKQWSDDDQRPITALSRAHSSRLRRQRRRGAERNDPIPTSLG